MIQYVRMHKRIVFLFAICSIFLLVLVVRLGIVQLRDGPFLKGIADDYHFRGVPVAPKRGNIEDCNGNVLAMSVSTQTVYAIPAEVKNPAAVMKSQISLPKFSGKTRRTF